MNKVNSFSKISFGLAVLAGLMPLSFTFTDNEVTLLLETSSKYLVWTTMIVCLLVLLLARPNLHKNQTMGLAALYVLVPMTFSFTENGMTFLILNQYPSTVLSWLTASILLSNLFLNSNNQAFNDR